jgi:hypothetical protein
LSAVADDSGSSAGPRVRRNPAADTEDAERSFGRRVLRM